MKLSCIWGCSWLRYFALFDYQVICWILLRLIVYHIWVGMRCVTNITVTITETNCWNSQLASTRSLNVFILSTWLLIPSIRSYVYITQFPNKFKTRTKWPSNNEVSALRKSNSLLLEPSWWSNRGAHHILHWAEHTIREIQMRYNRRLIPLRPQYRDKQYSRRDRF